MEFFNSAASQYAENTLSVLQFTSLVDSSSVKFMAFLTSLNQTFNSTWTAEQVYGRNDPIANFQGTQRNLSLAWDVPAANIEEAKMNMARVSSLTKMLYPGYTQGTIRVKRNPSADALIGEDQTIAVGSNALSLSKAPLIRLKFANLINDSVKPAGEGLLGYVGNLNINPTLDMGMFTEKKKLYPKVYSLSIDFTVLHEHDLGKTSPAGQLFGDAKSFPYGG